MSKCNQTEARAQHTPVRNLSHRFRCIVAAMLMGCIGINTALATGLSYTNGTEAPASYKNELHEEFLSIESAIRTQEEFDDFISKLDPEALAELRGIYAVYDLAEDSTADTGEASEHQRKGIREKIIAAAIKAVMKSKAFYAALRNVNYQVYAWYLQNQGRILGAIDAAASFSYNAILTALLAARVPEHYAKIIAKVISWFV